MLARSQADKEDKIVARLRNRRPYVNLQMVANGEDMVIVSNHPLLVQILHLT